MSGNAELSTGARDRAALWGAGLFNLPGLGSWDVVVFLLVYSERQQTVNNAECNQDKRGNGESA